MLKKAFGHVSRSGGRAVRLADCKPHRPGSGENRLGIEICDISIEELMEEYEKESTLPISGQNFSNPVNLTGKSWKRRFISTEHLID